MAKKIMAVVTIQIPAGRAVPGPPVGPALGAYGINLPMFIKQYNEESAKQYEPGTIVPAKVTVFGDRSFTFELKTPPAGVLVAQALGIEKGAANPLMENVGTLSREQLRRVAEIKLPDLNTDDIEMAMRIVAGTCRQMGVRVEGEAAPVITEEMMADYLEAQAEAEAEAAGEGEVAADGAEEGAEEVASE